jgi:hypothetical protein
MQVAPFFRSVLPTAWPKLNTGYRSNQTKALAELRHKCGKRVANYHFAACRPLMFVAKHPRCIYIKRIVARTEEGFA